MIVKTWLILVFRVFYYFIPDSRTKVGNKSHNEYIMTMARHVLYCACFILSIISVLNHANQQQFHMQGHMHVI